MAEQAKQRLTELEGNKVSYKERLDLIKNIEKAIAEERKAVKEAKLKREAEEKAKVKLILVFTEIIGILIVEVFEGSRIKYNSFFEISSFKIFQGGSEERSRTCCS